MGRLLEGSQAVSGPLKRRIGLIGKAVSSAYTMQAGECYSADVYSRFGSNAVENPVCCHAE